MLEHRLLVLRVVVLRVLRDVAELARDADPLRDLAPLLGPQAVDLLLELLVAVCRENDFLQNQGLLTRRKRAGMVAGPSREVQPLPATIYRL